MVTMDGVNENVTNVTEVLANRSSPQIHDVPPEFTINVFIQVIVYSILFVIAAAGNLTVLVTLIRARHRKSRISLMMLHLTIADLLVTFIMIPLEIGWRITVQWTAGNAACKVFTVLRAFGLYLSSNVLVCVSMDRYFAIIHPLRVSDARRRGKLMLAFAWILSFVCASPQSVVFHVAAHPNYPNFFQCVTFGSFSSDSQEMTYNLFCVSAMYFVPLLAIVFAYSWILREVLSKTRETKEDNKAEGTRDSSLRGRLRLRRSDMSTIERARSRTLRMTITIVAVFIWCWTPYVFMTLWYMFDRDSAMKVDPKVQDALFTMAVSNSCMNPIVYGSYTLNLRKDCLCCLRGSYATNNKLRGSTSVHALALNVIGSKQPNEILQNLLPKIIEVKSTATTKTTAFQTSRGNRFTFSSDKNQAHSEVYMPADDDSGVSFSCKSRPYHSEPPNQPVLFHMDLIRSESIREAFTPMQQQ